MNKKCNFTCQQIHLLHLNCIVINYKYLFHLWDFVKWKTSVLLRVLENVEIILQSCDS